MTDEEAFQQDVEAIDDIIYEQVFPILEQIEEDFPGQSAYYNVFVNAMHVVFAQGWTKEDLIQEIEDHHEIFLENAQVDTTKLH